MVYVPDDEGDAWSDLDFVPDSEHELPSTDVPWEVGLGSPLREGRLAGGETYRNSFDASF
jgi:hypothetical protein